METKNVNQSGSSQNFNSSANFRSLYLLNGNTLLPLAPEYLDSNSPAEKNFRSEKELEELVFNNSKILFGQNTILVFLPKDSRTLFGNDFSPNGFLIDVGDLARPR